MLASPQRVPATLVCEGEAAPVGSINTSCRKLSTCNRDASMVVQLPAALLHSGSVCCGVPPGGTGAAVEVRPLKLKQAALMAALGCMCLMPHAA